MWVGSWGGTPFTERKGVFLVVIAPVLFLLSGLFLANTLVYPAESIPYQADQLLCFVIAPILFIAGIIIYVTARRAEKKESFVTARQAPIVIGRISKKICSECGGDVSQLSSKTKKCPYCGNEIPTQKIKVTSAKAVEISPKTKKIRRITKIIAILGLAVLVVSFLLLVF